MYGLLRMLVTCLAGADGWKLRQRANAADRDLNRWFPNVVKKCKHSLVSGT
jgi:murein tripeptide amidase MpaA